VAYAVSEGARRRVNSGWKLEQVLVGAFRNKDSFFELTATVPTDSLNKKQQLLNSLGSTKHDPHPLSDLVDELPFTRVVACVSQKVAAGGASLGIPGVVE
jgi:hypothetical protein